MTVTRTITAGKRLPSRELDQTSTAMQTFEPILS